MFNRHRAMPPVSFFAFQDIITGVTGVMLILVLLLIVHAWQNQSAGTVFAPPAGDRVAAQIAVLEAEEHALLRELDRQQSAARIQSVRQSRRMRLAALDAAQSELTEKLVNLRRESAVLQTTLSRNGGAPPPEAREYLTLLNEEQILLEKFHDRRNRLEIDPARLEKPPLLLECRRSEWVLTRPGAAPQLLGKGAPTLTAALTELRTILTELGPEKYLLVIAVRPGAGDYIAMLTRSLRHDFPALELAVEALPSDRSEAPRIR